VVLPEHVMRREAVARRYGIDQSELDDLEEARSKMTAAVRSPASALDPDAGDKLDLEDPTEGDEPPEPGA